MLKDVKNYLRRRSSKTAKIPVNNPYASPVGPTFEEFLKHITTANYNDEHWVPYYKHCALCHMEYDFILK